jgi:hypothetical protein
MRLWTLHPKHLDARGLVAVWRDPKRLRNLSSIKIPAPHPLFKIVSGKVRDWEKM